MQDQEKLRELASDLLSLVLEPASSFAAVESPFLRDQEKLRELASDLLSFHQASSFALIMAKALDYT